MTHKQAAREKKVAEARAKGDVGMKFDWNDPYKKPVKKPAQQYNSSEGLFGTGQKKK